MKPLRSLRFVHYDSNPNQLNFTAWIGSLSSGLMFLTSILAIKMCDITSVSTTLVLGAILSGSGLILTSFVQNFNALYFVYGVLFGTGTSLLYTPCLIMIGRWFVKYQAVTTGLAVASCALGAVVLSPLIQHIIRINGLRQAIRTCGIAYSTIAFVCALCFKPFKNNTTSSPIHEDELECFQLEISHYDSLKMRGEIINKQNEENEEQNDIREDYEISLMRNNFTLNWQLLGNKQYILFLVAMMLTNFTYYMPVVHLVILFKTLFTTQK